MHGPVTRDTFRGVLPTPYPLPLLLAWPGRVGIRQVWSSRRHHHHHLSLCLLGISEYSRAISLHASPAVPLQDTGADGLNPRYAPLRLLVPSVPPSTTLSSTFLALALVPYVPGRILVTRHTIAVCLLLVQTLSSSRRRRSGLAPKTQQLPSTAPQRNQISTTRLLTYPKFTNPNGFRTITVEPENLATRPPR